MLGAGCWDLGICLMFAVVSVLPYGEGEVADGDVPDGEVADGEVGRG